MSRLTGVEPRDVMFFDIETNGLLPAVSKIHCLSTRKAGITKSYYGSSLWEGLSLLSKEQYICGHNIVGYDIPVIKHLYPSWVHEGTPFDTIIMSKLFFPNRKDLDFALFNAGQLPGQMIGRHSLESWGLRLGTHKGDFGKRTDWSEFSEEMLAYCEQDLLVTEALFEYLLGSSVKDELCVDIEHEVGRILIEQELHGWKFNIAKAEKLYITLVGEKATVEKELLHWFDDIVVEEEFTPKVNNSKLGYEKGVTIIKRRVTPVNLSSRDHIAWNLQNKYGWKPTEFGKDGKPRVDERVLAPLGYPFIPQLLRYLMLVKRIGQVAEGDKAWLRFYNRETGRIYGEVDSFGTDTGRMSHRNPNIAQTPAAEAETPYGYECRECWEVPEGCVQVGTDAKGLELRCLAHYMGAYDEGRYAHEVCEGDPHSVNQQAAGLPTRSSAKTFIYAFLYGAGDAKIGSIVGKGASAGRKIKKQFLSKIPALASLQNAITSALAQRGHLRGADGRRTYVRSKHAALNYLLQGLGAIIMKVAVVQLDAKLKALPFAVHIVGNIHDEWQMEVHSTNEDDIKLVQRLSIESIEEAGKILNLRCPVTGDSKVGLNWAETH